MRRRNENANASSTSTATIQGLLLREEEPIIKFIRQLLSESEPKRRNVIKNVIVHLVEEKQVNIRALTLDQQSVTEILFEYYQTKESASDKLFDLLQRANFEAFMIDFLEQRFGQDINFQLRICEPQADPRYQKFTNTAHVSWDCTHLSEAILIVYTLEELLQATFAIPPRAATKDLPVIFEKLNDHEIRIHLNYRPKEYQKVNPLIPLVIPDSQVWEMYTDPHCDFYDYVEKKYKLPNTRCLSPVRSMPVAEEAINQLAQEAIAVRTQSHPADYQGELLIFTRTLLCSGNFMNARRTIEDLCNQWPKAKITWIVVNDGDKLPETPSLPPQVSRFEADAEWKLYPIIQAKSMTADVIIGLPGSFIIHMEMSSTNAFLRNDPLFIVVHEYNYRENPDETGPRYLHLYSGVNAGELSLGILKPPSLALPQTPAAQLAELREFSCTASLFQHHPEAPLYFGYLYEAKKQVEFATIQGLKIDEVLAIFVQQAKLAKHSHIKIVLPISGEVLQEALQNYPTIFKGCQVVYNEAAFLSDPESELTIEVFNPFPLPNVVFRALMHYSALQENLVVTTGDQSLVEMFFTIESGFLFLYQIMGHKKELFAALKTITEKCELRILQALFHRIEFGMNAQETEIIALSEFITQNKSALQEESLLLRAEIQNQPDFGSTLVRVMEACLRHMQKLTLEEAATPAPSC